MAARYSGQWIASLEKEYWEQFTFLGPRNNLRMLWNHSSISTGWNQFMLVATGFLFFSPCDLIVTIILVIIIFHYSVDSPISRPMAS